MPRPSRRAERVGDLIREEISLLLLRAVKDPRLQGVTITGVRLSDDLRHARVYFAGERSPDGQARQLAGLRSAAGFLRGELTRRLRLRFAPELIFFVDETLEQGLRIADLLRAVAEAAEAGRPEGGDVEPRQPQHVIVVSHGPSCLDGVSAAVCLARFYEGATVAPRFCYPSDVDALITEVRATETGADAELWITDVTWRRLETEAHLQSLRDRALRIYWVDHHQPALERVRRGGLEAFLTDWVVSDAFSAARLLYEYLARRPAGQGPRFAAFAPVVALADDADRWVHALPGSRQLAMTVSALDGTAAFEELLTLGADLEYTPRMRAAWETAQRDCAKSMELARQTLTVRLGDVDRPGIAAALCAGYPSDVADAVGADHPDKILALYDVRDLKVSLRRGSACGADLATLAAALGGGGHPAAAGFPARGLHRALTEALLDRTGTALRGLSIPRGAEGR